MVILIHVVIACISVGYTTFLLFSPSKTKLIITYILFCMTVVSGTYLIITMPAHMMQTCLEGLGYMAFVIGGIIFAHAKIVHRQAL